VAGKTGTVATSALACDITESIADSMLHADTTLRLVAWASSDPVTDATEVFGGLDNCASASEPSDLTVATCSLLVSSCRGLLENTTLEPFMRSANSDDLLIFGGLLQPHMS